MNLSRREYLAGMAMQGMLQNSKGLSAIANEAEKRGMTCERAVAEGALSFADALIAELDKDIPANPLPF